MAERHIGPGVTRLEVARTSRNGCPLCLLYPGKPHPADLRSLQKFEKVE
jgi:hypothetical protein